MVTGPSSSMRGKYCVDSYASIYAVIRFMDNDIVYIAPRH